MDRTRLAWRGIHAACFAAGVALGWPEGSAQAEAEVPYPPPATERVARSDGCGKPAPAAPPASVEVGGRERALIVAIPEGYRPDAPLPLVVAFHGRTSPAERVRRYYGLEGEGPPAIFVYPGALPAGDGRFSWQDPGDRAGALRDFALFDRVLETMAATYCLDRERVFVVGHSLGASFANDLACARGDRIRGVAAVGGGISRAPCAGEVAALVMHNPKDEQVPVAEGERARDAHLARNRLAGSPAEPVRVGGFACLRWGGPAAAAPVVWCPHDEDRDHAGRYYPHTWPESAGSAIMGFFAGLDAPAVAEAE
jgi:polyhydroxybutyrate depolymerase